MLAAYPVKRAVDVNVAYGLNEQGWSEDEAIAYCAPLVAGRGGPGGEGGRFCSHPLWSAYVPTYAYGYRLVRPFVDRAEGNFRRLLTEQLTTADLTA